MTRTQLRDLPRQDLVELARKAQGLCVPPAFLRMVTEELADRLEDCGRTDDYPFNSQPITNEDQPHEH